MSSLEGPSQLKRLFEEGLFGKCLPKGETLSVYSRALNISTNVVGIFRHKRLDSPDRICQKHKKEMHFSSQEHQYGADQKPSGVRINILVGRKQRECLSMVIFVMIKSESLRDGEGTVFIPVGAVVVDEDKMVCATARSLNQNHLGWFR